YVAYFQAFTNTYAPVEELRQKYEEALSCEGVEGISIATRADCLPEDVLDLLTELNQKTRLWVELGLQTADEASAEFIRRGYPYSVFEKAVLNLAERNIPVIVHVILGLPNENRDTILKTIDCVNRLPVQGIKLQLLHVLSDSDLAEIYHTDEYTPLTKEEYIALVGDCIAHLREDIVIHRITGDGDKNTLLAPLWSLRKRDVLNSIHKYLKENHIRQGMSCKFD
ncbi:MAG: TIGR01212 family radical SAM protein, partial [Anaerotignum sp.]|nr:TIGR01212 family radical SAM protein [Anaerotignum sp.]